MVTPVTSLKEWSLRHLCQDLLNSRMQCYINRVIFLPRYWVYYNKKCAWIHVFYFYWNQYEFKMSIERVEFNIYFQVLNSWDWRKNLAFKIKSAFPIKHYIIMKTERRSPVYVLWEACFWAAVTLHKKGDPAVVHLLDWSFALLLQKRQSPR